MFSRIGACVNLQVIDGCAAWRPSPSVAALKGALLLLWDTYPSTVQTPFYLAQRLGRLFCNTLVELALPPFRLLDPGTDNLSPCGDHGSDGALNAMIYTNPSC